MPEPSVTVVVTAFEEEAFIAAAIESVLEQTYSGEVEPIVVDNGSSDHSAKVAAGYEEVTVLRLEENRLPAGARNAGVAAGRGELVTFLDGDDQMLAERLEIQVGHLREHPEVGCVVGSQEVAFEEGAAPPFWVGGSGDGLVGENWGGEPSDTPNVYATSMLMSRLTFEASGGFDEKIAIGADDADLLLRLIESGVEVARLNDVIVRRRVHDSSLTQNAGASKTALLEVFKHRIERHRERRA